MFKYYVPYITGKMSTVKMLLVKCPMGKYPMGKCPMGNCQLGNCHGIRISLTLFVHIAIIYSKNFGFQKASQSIYRTLEEFQVRSGQLKSCQSQLCRRQ